MLYPDYLGETPSHSSPRGGIESFDNMMWLAVRPDTGKALEITTEGVVSQVETTIKTTQSIDDQMADIL